MFVPQPLRILVTNLPALFSDYPNPSKLIYLKLSCQVVFLVQKVSKKVWSLNFISHINMRLYIYTN